MSRQRLIIVIRVCLLLSLASALFGTGFFLLGAASLLVGLSIPVFGAMCDQCSGTVPANFQSIISGMANGNCGTCTDLNGTRTHSSFSNPATHECDWTFTLPATLCPGGADFTRAIVRFTTPVATRLVQIIFFNASGSLGEGRQVDSSAALFDCNTYDHTSTIGEFGGNFYCNFFSASVEVKKI